MNTKLERSWQCDVCGNIHIGPDVPRTCPKCGVGAEEFYVVNTTALSAGEEVQESKDKEEVKEVASTDAPAKQETEE